MDEVFYCGFNGFRQVPSQQDKQTITTLIAQSGKCSVAPTTEGSHKHHIKDVAICWNYLVVADSEGLVKYGLVNGKHGQSRLPLPPGGAKVRQVSATPRHILAITDSGECWAHEESKGWRYVNVNAEVSGDKLKNSSASLRPSSTNNRSRESLNNKDQPNQQQIRLIAEETTPNGVNKEANLIDLHGNSVSDSANDQIEDQDECDLKEQKLHESQTEQNMADKGACTTVNLVKTSCGDAHNIGLDEDGRAYSLPSPLDFNPFPSASTHKVTDVVCGKEHSILLTEHGQVFTWGGGSRGQLGHGNLASEDKPKLVMALDGLRIRKVAAGGWHSACISQFDDLYMFGWNESGQLAQPTNLTKPAECFSAVEKLFMACCTMQPEDDAALPRGFDSEDCEVYQKNNESSSVTGINHDEISLGTSGSASNLFGGSSCMGNSSGGMGNQLGNLFQSSGTGSVPLGCTEAMDSLEKDSLTCYTSTACNADSADLVVVQSLPMLVSLPDSNNMTSGCKLTAGGESDHTRAVDVACGSRHTVVLAKNDQLWAFGWNKYGQLGIGHNHSRDTPEKMNIPKHVTGKTLKMLRCGDWGTAVVVSSNKKF